MSSCDLLVPTLTPRTRTTRDADADARRETRARERVGERATEAVIIVTHADERRTTSSDAHACIHSFAAAREGPAGSRGGSISRVVTR